jgi:ABC-type dipeptide/oligopeptide/nickel transport system permease subunit
MALAKPFNAGLGEMAGYLKSKTVTGHKILIQLVYKLPYQVIELVFSAIFGASMCQKPPWFLALCIRKLDEVPST